MEGLGLVERVGISFNNSVTWGIPTDKSQKIRSVHSFVTLYRHMTAKQTEEIFQLGRAMFGAYNVKSGGLSWDGRPVPSWGEIQRREYDAQTIRSGSIAEIWKPDGVVANWCFVAEQVASVEEAIGMADKIFASLGDDPVFQRLVAPIGEVAG